MLRAISFATLALLVGTNAALAQGGANLFAGKTCFGTFDSGMGHFKSSGGFEMKFDPEGAAQMRRAYGYYAYHYAEDWVQHRQPSGINTIDREAFGAVAVSPTADGITFTNRESSGTVTIHYRTDGSFVGTFEPFSDKRDHWHESELAGACR